MSAAAYFETETLEAESLALADGARAFAPAGAKLPPGAEVDRLPAQRDSAVLGELMAWLDRLGEAMPDPVLFEVVRFELLFGLAPAHHAWSSLRALAARGVDQLEWFSPASRVLEPWRAWLPRAGASLGVTVRPRRLATETPPLRAAVKEALYPGADLVRRAWRARPEPAPAAPVVFVEFFRNNVHVVEPVVRELHGLGTEATVLATRHELRDALAADVPRVDLEGLLGRGDLRGLVPPAARQARGIAALLSAPSSLFTHVAGPLHRVALAPLLTRALWLAANWKRRFEHAFDRLRPRLVASTTYSSTLGRAAAVVAQARGIPTLWLQHGAYPDQAVWARFLHEHLAVFGEATAESIARHGVATTRLHPVGASLYDGFITRIRATAGRPFEKHAVFFASRSGGMVVSHGAARATLETAVAVTRELGWRLTVKPHPSDATTIPEEACAGHPHVSLVRDRPSQSMILEADVVLVTSSTVGFEACIAKRPLIELNLTGIRDAGSYAADGAALAATDATSLAQSLRRLADDDRFREALTTAQSKVLDRHLAGAHGDAALRTAQLIRRLLGER